MLIGDEVGLIDVSTGKIELKDGEVMIKQEEVFGGKIFLTNQRLIRVFYAAILGAPNQIEVPLTEITHAGEKTVHPHGRGSVPAVVVEYAHLGKIMYVGFEPQTSSVDDWILHIRRMANLPADSQFTERKDIKQPSTLQIILFIIILLIVIIALGIYNIK